MLSAPPFQAEPFVPKPFVPRAWLSNPHLQTIFGNFLPRMNHLPESIPVYIAVAPDCQVLCECHWQPEPADKLTVLLLHGLEGSSDSQYIIGNANKLWRAGANIIRMNMRTCGGTESLSPTLYHSGMSGDILCVLDQFVALYGLTRTAVVGYSMGGNLVLKLAGDLGSAPPPSLCAVVAVSPAADLASTAEALHLPQNRLYERRFLRGLIERYKRKCKLFPAMYDPARTHGIRTLRDFDERITSFYSGFASAADYYYRAAAARVLDRITVPTLILHALDDPFIRLTPTTRELIERNAAITFVEPIHGGHCAFLGNPVEGTDNDGYWAETTSLAFLLQQSARVSLR